MNVNFLIHLICAFVTFFGIVTKFKDIGYFESLYDIQSGLDDLKEVVDEISDEKTALQNTEFLSVDAVRKVLKGKWFSVYFYTIGFVCSLVCVFQDLNV
jgi:hypothetical protein